MGKLKILVIEDEKHLRALISDLLAERFEIEETESSHEAMERIGVEEYDLLIVDIKLGAESGIHLYDWIKDNHPDLISRVLVVTGNTSCEVTKEFLERTEVTYLAKPFNIDEFTKIVDKILKK
jgi:DNA-binding NtrC family response regulator